MNDGTGRTTYTYDSLHRLTQSTNGAGNQVQYGYDLNGHLTSLTYPGGSNKVTRTYDNAGRLATVADWLSHTTSFTYDANSNLTLETYPNSTTATFSARLGHR
jgi:YD repeat-containing protein